MARWLQAATRTSHCALHLRAPAEHMNNINAHATIHSPYGIAGVRSSTTLKEMPELAPTLQQKCTMVSPWILTTTSACAPEVLSWNWSLKVGDRSEAFPGAHPLGLPQACFMNYMTHWSPLTMQILWKVVLSLQSMISDPSTSPAVSGTLWWHLTPWHRHWWANCSSPGRAAKHQSSQMVGKSG